MNSLKGVFGGSGSDLIGRPDVSSEILRLAGKEPSNLTVLYLGTATYDDSSSQNRQTSYLKKSGCTIVSLKLAHDPLPSSEEIKEQFEKADIILVSGGNTLFAVDTWIRLGIVEHLRKAMERGVVLSGGSAGAICWFDGGHSDSMDPTSYKNVSSLPSGKWEYIRVDGVGFLPGLLCPHHDRTQSNGVLRRDDFDQMLLRHSGETGIGIDHFAVLVVDGEDYMWFSVEEGAGIWIKEVEDGKIVCRSLEKRGKVCDFLREARFIEKDPRVEICRQQNPF